MICTEFISLINDNASKYTLPSVWWRLHISLPAVTIYRQKQTHPTVTSVLPLRFKLWLHGYVSVTATSRFICLRSTCADCSTWFYINGTKRHTAVIRVTFRCSREFIGFAWIVWGTEEVGLWGTFAQLSQGCVEVSLAWTSVLFRLRSDADCHLLRHLFVCW